MSKRKFKEELKVDEHPVWSPSRLDLAEMCMKAYWLKYVKHVKPIITASTARGKLIHSMIESFWKKDKYGKIIPEPKFCYSGFVNTGVARWTRFYANPQKGEKSPVDEIKWDFPGQQWSKFFKGELVDMLGRVYNRYITEEPRLEAEITFLAEAEGIKIMAIIDELRKDLIIRDHKSGYKKPSPEYLAKNIQMTDYLLCLFISLQDINSVVSRKIYPTHFGISLEEFLKIATIEIHHLPDINRPYFNRKEAVVVYPQKDPMTSIYTAKRTPYNIEDFIDTLKAKEKSIAERDFHPTQGRHCEGCFMKADCDKYDPKKEHANELERNMPLFSYSNLGFGNMRSTNPILNPPATPAEVYKQKTMRFKYVTPETTEPIKEVKKEPEQETEKLAEKTE